MSDGGTSDHALVAAIRTDVGPLVASLHRRYGDFDVAEEAVQTAVVEALRTWRRDGVPDRPGAWLQVAARRNAIDLLRKPDRARRVDLGAPTFDRADVDAVPASSDDERLALLFACCHPALAPEVRLALTMRAVVGLTTQQIARAFLVAESTLAQRIVRAKRKIVANAIQLEIPDADRLAERLDDVLTVVYLMYNEAYVSTSGTAYDDRDLGADAVWLADNIAVQLPRQAEAWGLAALLNLQHARAASRFDGEGALILLPQQDRSRWDRRLIETAESMLERAASLRAPGRFQLQAAIAACHASAPSWDDTDWLQILTLYDLLQQYDRSPVLRLNHAVARAQVSGPVEALAEVEALRDELAGYHLWHATRAELLRQVGRQPEAAASDAEALALTTNPAEQRLLRARLGLPG